MNTPAAPDSAFEAFIIPAFKRKAASVTAIDVRNLTSYADMIMIIEGTSKRQVSSIAEYLIRDLKKQDITALGVEGVKEGEWALLDYGDVIIHVFESRKKDFFNIEGLWADAPRMDLTAYENKYEQPENDDD